jgi:hypothetical protein
MNWDRGLTANVWDLYDGQERVGKVIRLGTKFQIEYGTDTIGWREDLETAKQFLESYAKHQSRMTGL